MMFSMNTTPDPKSEAARAFKAKEFDAAAHLFERALEVEPEMAELWHDLGQTYRALNRLVDAADAFNKAAELRSDFGEPLNSLGALSRLVGNLEMAADYYYQAIARRPDFPEVYFNLGVLADEQGDPESARRHYESALEHRPNYLQAQNNLAVLMTDAGEFSEAEALLRAALGEVPESAELWTSLGTCLRHTGSLDKAGEAYQQALSLKNDFQEAAWNVSLVQLAQGAFKTGWANYRHRPSAGREKRPMPDETLPPGLTGRRFALEGEQGLGDELFFLRFVPALLERGATVTYRGDARLEGMISRGLPDLAAGDDSADLVRIADLPYLLESEDTPPSLVIPALERKLEEAREALRDAGPPPYAGLTYRAGLQGEGALFKEAPLKEVAQLLSGLPGTILNLQRDQLDQEQEELFRCLGNRIADFSACNEDLEAMLALLSLLDDYIGVSNTNMHLRAAAGQTARVLVPQPAGHRWMAAGGSPWFRGFPVYRQAPDGSWDEAFRSLSSDLKASHG